LVYFLIFSKQNLHSEYDDFLLPTPLVHPPPQETATDKATRKLLTLGGHGDFGALIEQV
jgi:hypothetical protein